MQRAERRLWKGVLATAGRHFSERRKTEFGNAENARRDTEADAKILRGMNNQRSSLKRLSVFNSARVSII